MGKKVRVESVAISHELAIVLDTLEARAMSALAMSELGGHPHGLHGCISAAACSVMGSRGTFELPRGC